MKKFIFPLFIIFCFGFGSLFAQTTPKKIEPLKTGENLAYEGKYSKLILRGLDVADLSFTIENMPDGNDYLVKSEARSKGSLIKLFGFKFYQNIESTIDGENFAVVKTVKRDEQGDRIRESESVFDYQKNKVTYIETDPTDMARPPRHVASPIEAGTQDIVTGIYMIRRLPLAVGKTFELTVSDSGLIYKIPVRVTAREKQKSVIGKNWCFRVEPEIFGKDRLIDRDGSMIIWITDDARRIPVRSQINTDIGRFEVKLRQLNYKPLAAVTAK